MDSTPVHWRLVFEVGETKHSFVELLPPSCLVLTSSDSTSSWVSLDEIQEEGQTADEVFIQSSEPESSTAFLPGVGSWIEALKFDSLSLNNEIGLLPQVCRIPAYSSPKFLKITPRIPRDEISGQIAAAETQKRPEIPVVSTKKGRHLTTIIKTSPKNPRFVRESSPGDSMSSSERSFVEGYSPDNATISHSSAVNTFVAALSAKWLSCVMLVYNGSDSSAAQSSQNSGKANNLQSGDKASKQSSNNQTKYRRRTNDSEDGNDQDDDNRKRKRPLSDIASDIGQTERLFACPYAKNGQMKYPGQNPQPVRYRGCSSCVLRSMARVKQHLKRNHTRPKFFCNRCNQNFKNEVDLFAHQRETPICETQPAQYGDKMTQTQADLIRRRTRKTDECEYWFEIYQILFPNERRPLSPFSDHRDSFAVRAVADVFQRYGPHFFQEVEAEHLQNGTALPPLPEATRPVIDEAWELVVKDFARQNSAGNVQENGIGCAIPSGYTHIAPAPALHRQDFVPGSNVGNFALDCSTMLRINNSNINSASIRNNHVAESFPDAQLIDASQNNNFMPVHEYPSAETVSREVDNQTQQQFGVIHEDEPYQEICYWHQNYDGPGG